VVNSTMKLSVTMSHAYGCCRNVQQCQPYFRNLRRHSTEKTANSSTSATTLRLMTVCEKRFWISRSNLYCQKLESLIYIYTAVGLCFITFSFSHSYFWKLNPVSLKVLAQKQSLTLWHSRSF